MTLPLPPLELRTIVGPLTDELYDNPSGAEIWGALDFGPLRPGQAYEQVFDFGCGCGRNARQLLLQSTPPKRYVGIDINKKCLDWCTQNLANPHTEFHFHDVWSPSYAPSNTKQDHAPIAQHGAEFTLINAHSVFTHLLEGPTKYYLSQFSAMLAPTGIVRSTWLLFDRRLFPPLAAEQHCLYLSVEDPTQAVYYDYSSFLALIRESGFKIIHVDWSLTMGFQHIFYLARGDQFVDLADQLVPHNVPGYDAAAAPRAAASGPNPQAARHRSLLTDSLMRPLLSAATKLKRATDRPYHWAQRYWEGRT